MSFSAFAGFCRPYRVSDIAHILHSKKGTVSSQLYQARALLRDALKEEDL